MSDPPEVGSPAWWARFYVPKTAKRSRPGGLSIDRILSVALEIVDTHGLEALTMRELATRLGTAHTSLYRHVSNRDELMVRLIDYVLSEISQPRESLGVRRYAEHQAREYRRVLLKHRNVVPLLINGQLLGPNAMKAREASLAASMEGGLGPSFAVNAYLTIAHFVIGSVLLDSGGASRTLDQRRAMTELFSSLPDEEFPTVNRLSVELNEPDSDAEFEFGLRVLMDGLESNAFGGQVG